MLTEVVVVGAFVGLAWLTLHLDDVERAKWEREHGGRNGA